ncbi:transporter family-2 protein [Geosporobacter subterraneus DSM 17957]|uniref:Transporter family-2 protein n=1 Tax=Geosporobacter subterraneus DSM 17957 TaxID=1121919 RepID=A0A1M6I6I3_9FIRM|nr:DMT family transporter [Geosporobacter subterraneus]SHJ30014.1 transporter family-2 protein [Geosporobacter subterraneus DSM 17957]
MKESLALIFAILAGIFTTLEASINAKLGKIVTPKIATLHNLLTGVLVILVANILKGTIHQYRKIIHVNPQLLVGGIFGTFIVYFVTKAIPKLGVATTLTIIVASQVISGLFFDIVISKQDHLDWFKCFGIILLLLGTYLTVKQ